MGNWASCGGRKRVSGGQPLALPPPQTHPDTRGRYYHTLIRSPYGRGVPLSAIPRRGLPGLTHTPHPQFQVRGQCPSSRVQEQCLLHLSHDGRQCLSPRCRTRLRIPGPPAWARETVPHPNYATRAYPKNAGDSKNSEGCFYGFRTITPSTQRKVLVGSGESKRNP